MDEINIYKNDFERCQTALQLIDDVILKNYISKLSDLEVVPLNQDKFQNINDNNVSFFKINKMVYEKEESALHKFSSVFNALSTIKGSIFIIVDSDGEKTDFYMGVCSSDSERTISLLRDILKNSIKGQFPGIKTSDNYTRDEMKDILSKFNHRNISSVSCVANNKSQNLYTNENFVQGLEKLVLSMQGNKYTGIIMANCTTDTQLREIQKVYENLYTQLSPFASKQISYANHNSIQKSSTQTEGKSFSNTYNKSYTETKSESFTDGNSTTDGTTKESGLNTAIKVAGIATTLLAPQIAPYALLMSSLVGQRSKSHSETINFSKSKSYSKSTGESEGWTNSTNNSTSNTVGSSTGISESMMLSFHNKSIENTLKRIDEQLNRIYEFESLGMYECAAYFMSNESGVAEMAATTYKALIKGENSGVEVSAINTWGIDEKYKNKLISEYLFNFTHPIFKYFGPTGEIEVTPCSLVSGNELAIHMGLPRSSVCGFPVIEHVDFAKEIVTYDGNNSFSGINLGKIFNMGSECESKVKLDINSLSMHTFVTGSTGSGKSNTVYEILRQLNNSGINYMIIEPVKGEYKNIFGNDLNTKVFGTNPDYMEMLRINPFKFPKGIHILEHVDRIIEIFNVCWPMYAAMPSILKEAILQSYEVCGWDLTNSENVYSKDLFPTFNDLLNELINVIDKSGYSGEVKSNYIGALVTRVKSLTNGLNGQIFSSKEINNSQLFDKNVIIDLSRVGSSETKSLIMGILIMRLNEYRMSTCKEMNIPLKHVTVIEEAHNILKRTIDQNIDGANLIGKSVEMISNAIAEMRTYGEGFIIVDQSPNSVDISAIRNTNTKIIMRLPDEQDRQLAGKSASLKDKQVDEISRLPKGVAVVYQNDWIEPVLCKVRKYEGSKNDFKFILSKSCNDSNKKFRSEILKLFLKDRVNEVVDINIDYIIELLEETNILVKSKLKLKELLNLYKKDGNLSFLEEDKFGELSKFISEILDSESSVIFALKKSNSFEELTNILMEFVNRQTHDLSKSFVLAACQCLMKSESLKDDEKQEIYAAWITSLRNKEVF